MGSTPPGLLDKRPVRLPARSPASHAGQRGSKPLRAASFRGRLTAGRRALNPPVLVRLQPPELHTSVVKRRTRLPPKEQVQVRILAGVLTNASVVKRTSRGSAKSEVLVRLRAEALWPNPKWLRDPAVNRGCVGSTPTGHPKTPAMPDRPGTALVTRTKWVRVPPLALFDMTPGPDGQAVGCNPTRSRFDSCRRL